MDNELTTGYDISSSIPIPSMPASFYPGRAPISAILSGSASEATGSVAVASGNAGSSGGSSASSASAAAGVAGASTLATSYFVSSASATGAAGASQQTTTPSWGGWSQGGNGGAGGFGSGWANQNAAVEDASSSAAASTVTPAPKSCGKNNSAKLRRH